MRAPQARCGRHPYPPKAALPARGAHGPLGRARPMVVVAPVPLRNAREIPAESFPRLRSASVTLPGASQISMKAAQVSRSAAQVSRSAALFIAIASLPALADAVLSRTAASRARGASVRTSRERLSGLRKPPRNSLDVSAASSSSRPSLRAARPSGSAAFRARGAAPVRRRAPPPARMASLLHDQSRVPRLVSRPSKRHRRALDSLGRPTRNEGGATRFPGRPARFLRLPHQSQGRARFAPRLATTTRLPCVNTGRLVARPSRLSP